MDTPRSEYALCVLSAVDVHVRVPLAPGVPAMINFRTQRHILKWAPPPVTANGDLSGPAVDAEIATRR